MSTVDYLPIAVSGSANVDSQADFVGSGYQLNGFTAGIAESDKLNKCWRQSSMIGAAVANFIANTLGINVLDDGNIANLITELTNAIRAVGLQSLNTTPVTANGVVSGNQNLMSYAIPAVVQNVVGKILRLTAYGFFSTPAVTETVSLGLTVGANTQQFISIGIGGSAVATLCWKFVLDLITTATGATGTLQAGGSVVAGTSTGVTANAGGSQTSFTNANLLAGQTVQFFVDFSGTPSASNTCTQNILIVEALN